MIGYEYINKEKKEKTNHMKKYSSKVLQELHSKEKVKIEGFYYKSFEEIATEFKNCKDIFAKLDYAKQLKKDAYDYVLDLDLDKTIRKLQNQIVINY